jgi:hypothetical protein
MMNEIRYKKEGWFDGINGEEIHPKTMEITRELINKTLVVNPKFMPIISPVETKSQRVKKLKLLQVQQFMEK